MSIQRDRIGVFVCHCGLNIAGTVDVKKVVEEIGNYPGVVHAEDYMYMCSDPGQELMRKAMREKRLNGIINANCSPSLHEKTFRRLVESEGLNPYYCEIANIREQCSWPHAGNKQIATQKAIGIIKATIERLRRNMALTPSVIPLTKRALVIGAGLAGIQSSLDIADSGYEVVLVEKEPYIGGHTIQLSSTFPSLERPDYLIADKIKEVVNHPGITLYTNSDIEEVNGYVGNFVVKIKRKAQYVDNDLCTNCGLCLEKCPVSVPSEFERGLSQRKAVYMLPEPNYPQKPIIDNENCLNARGEQCLICTEVCPVKAINMTRQDEYIEEEVGAIIAAPGYELLPREKIGFYPEDPDIIDGLQFERILSYSQRTGDTVRRPSDGRIPEEIVFIQCAGSRDLEHGVPYCSRVCCMYTAKQAFLYRKLVPEGQAYICYMDIRSDAKGFEEFVQDVMSNDGILYIRGNVSKVFRDGDKIKVWGVDTLIGKNIEISADLVVLATAMVPRPDTRELSRKLNIITDEHGFLSEAHIKLRPVESLTSGVYLAGTAQWPRDLPDTVSSASAAASKVISLFSRKELLHEPAIAFVDEEVCTGCGVCVSICTYKAISLDDKNKVARVNEALCEGCGACSVACPSKAMQHKNLSHRQIFEIIDVAAVGHV